MLNLIERNDSWIEEKLQMERQAVRNISKFKKCSEPEKVKIQSEDEWGSDWACNWVSKWKSEWLTEQVSAWVTEWASYCTGKGKWVSEWVIG